MKKIALLLPVMLALEAWAFSIYRDHPLGGRPAHFHVITLIVQFLMVWGGVESARWLLRRSPVSKVGGPFDDGTRLWVWLGPVGGIWLALACLAGKWLSESELGPLAGFLVVAHFSGGALLWCLAAAWTIPSLMADTDSSRRDYALAALGLIAHLVGFAAYALVFPGERTPLRLAIHPILYLIASSLVFCYLTFYIYASVLTWAPLLALLRKSDRDKG